MFAKTASSVIYLNSFNPSLCRELHKPIQTQENCPDHKLIINLWIPHNSGPSYHKLMNPASMNCRFTSTKPKWNQADYRKQANCLDVNPQLRDRASIELNDAVSLLRFLLTTWSKVWPYQQDHHKTGEGNLGETCLISSHLATKFPGVEINTMAPISSHELAQPLPAVPKLKLPKNNSRPLRTLPRAFRFSTKSSFCGEGKLSGSDQTPRPGAFGDWPFN